MTCGVYLIKSDKSKKVYIGSSKDIEGRFKAHMRNLEKGKHHSYKLQEHYDQEHPKLSLVIIKVCKPIWLPDFELKYINEYKSVRHGFNVSYSTRRSNNPDIRHLNILRRAFNKFRKGSLNLRDIRFEFDDLTDKSFHEFCLKTTEFLQRIPEFVLMKEKMIIKYDGTNISYELVAFHKGKAKISPDISKQLVERIRQVASAKYPDIL